MDHELLARRTALALRACVVCRDPTRAILILRVEPEEIEVSTSLYGLCEGCVRILNLSPFFVHSKN